VSVYGTVSLAYTGLFLATSYSWESNQ